MSRREGKRSSQRQFEQANGHLGWCSACGKATYHDKAAAKRAIRQMKGRNGRLNAYRCIGTDMWHVGHLPERVTSGEIDRSQLNVSDKRLGRPTPRGVIS